MWNLIWSRDALLSGIFRNPINICSFQLNIKNSKKWRGFYVSKILKEEINFESANNITQPFLVYILSNELYKIYAICMNALLFLIIRIRNRLIVLVLWFKHMTHTVSHLSAKYAYIYCDIKISLNFIKPLWCNTIYNIRT